MLLPPGGTSSLHAPGGRPHTPWLWLLGGASPTISTSSSLLGGRGGGGGGGGAGRAGAGGCSGGCRRTGGERAWLLQVLSNTTTGSSLDASPGVGSAAGTLAWATGAALASGGPELGAAAPGGLPRQALSEVPRGGLPCLLFRRRLSSLPQGLPVWPGGLLQTLLEGLPEGLLLVLFRAEGLLVVLLLAPPGGLLPRSSWGLRVGLLTLQSVASPLPEGLRVGLLARVSGAVRGELVKFSYAPGLGLEPCL